MYVLLLLTMGFVCIGPATDNHEQDRSHGEEVQEEDVFGLPSGEEGGAGYLVRAWARG